MGTHKGEKRAWHAGHPRVDDRKKVTVHLTEGLYDYAKQHGNASWYIRQLIQADKDKDRNIYK